MAICPNHKQLLSTALSGTKTDAACKVQPAEPALVAQLAVRRTLNPNVPGSRPGGGKTTRVVIFYWLAHPVLFSAPLLQHSYNIPPHNTETLTTFLQRLQHFYNILLIKDPLSPHYGRQTHF